MSEEAHDLMVLAMLDLPKDPHGMGPVIRVEGSRTTRTFVLGGVGMILYVVDDIAETVEIADVMWIS
jgi:hypothetical protein